MPGKILIVDGVAINRIALKIRMNAAFYEVITATCHAEACRRARDERPDLILMNAQLSDISGLDACKALKSQDHSCAIPIILIAATAQDCNITAALQAGADDLLIKPLNDTVMLARIRSLLRSRDAGAELHLQESASHALGFGESDARFTPRASALLVTADSASGRRWASVLAQQTPYHLADTRFDNALRNAHGQKAPDVIILMLSQDSSQRGLQLLAEIRARASTRHAGVLIVLKGCDQALVVEALDRGANDVMCDGANMEELALRLSSLVTRKHRIDRLRNKIHDGLQAAVVDPLTGLHNRRYAMPQLDRMTATARRGNRNLSIMVADLDFFKRINDRYGHAAGDAVLVEVAKRLRDNLRPVDLVARIGGEEFLIALPDTALSSARKTARQLCALVANEPIHIAEQDLSVHVTISIGVATGGDANQPASYAANTLLDLADRALFGAKASGRNQVTLTGTAR